jgi:hypothetical protein
MKLAPYFVGTNFTLYLLSYVVEATLETTDPQACSACSTRQAFWT